MTTWTKQQDGQSTIYVRGGTTLTIHKIGRCVYLNTGKQFIPYTSVATAKARIDERMRGGAWRWAGDAEPWSAR